MDAVIVSDWHLGAALCQRRTISRFLDGLHHSVSTLIINGDLIECPNKSLKKEDWRILDQLRLVAKERRLIWVRGNHDPKHSYLASLIGAEYADEFKFEQAGREIHCIHGDKWDSYITQHPILTWIGDSVYNSIVRINKSLARKLKHANKEVLRCQSMVAAGAMKLITDFTKSVICCGHTHHAEQIGESYFNSGSWTEEPCTYLLARNGSIEIKTFEQ